MTEYLTISEASNTFGLCAKTLRRMFDEGSITGYRTEGGHRRISVESMRQYATRLDAGAQDIVRRVYGR